MGLGLGNVGISDTETEAAAESTAAALRVTCCVTRTRERGWSRVCGAVGCHATWGLHR